MHANTGSFRWVWATRSGFVAQTILRMTKAEIELGRLTGKFGNVVGMLQPR